MNKLTTSLALVSAMLVAGTTHAVDPSDSSRTETGTINFTGKVVGVTCTIGQAEGKQIDVPLNDALRSQLLQTGNTTGSKAFQIDFTGCQAGDNVALEFDSASRNIDSTTGNLKNIATANPAKDVQIQVLKEDGTTRIALNTRQTFPTKATSDTASLKFVAQYYAASNEVSIGAVQSSIGFNLNYN
ncbi:fimbrial protein [Acinetobacter gerneri]|jgi:major type 1 subunit fimbrin (pilin)|uniref:fimbrial protein n=1 Tax=Acinetobacter gerneri TaxID=202952 RepID=UPI0023F309AF|nr:fimbrial protein [Acinetobacter gerneri]MCH4244358.1 type 1 fimbrial protein [Acinetobacter gerneri]MDV2441631.1 fimbrial protein [Acinetobacter gerneri]